MDIGGWIHKYGWTEKTPGDPTSVPGSGRPLEEERAAHSSVLAWRTPCTEEPGGLPSMGSQSVGHD